MLRYVILLIFGCTISINSISQQQIPQGFTYQAAIQNNEGQPVSNASVPVRITIMSNSNNVWQETHNVTTNDQGIFSLTIGKGTRTGGNTSAFDDINWASMVYSVKTEVNLGSGYVDMGVTQLFSVPYALVSKTALEVVNAPSVSLDQLTNVDVTGLQTGDVLQWNGSKWVPLTQESLVTGNELSGSGTTANPLKLSQQSATTGQVLKWDGSKWSPSLDQTSSTGVQAVNVGTTLTGDGTTAAPLNLAKQGATTGQVLKWDGTKWSPAADNNTLTQNLNLTQNTDTNDPAAIKVTKSGTQGGANAVTIVSKSGEYNTALQVTSDNAAITSLPYIQTAAFIDAKGKGGTGGNIALAASANAQQGSNVAVSASVESANADYDHSAIESSVQTTLHEGFIGKGVFSYSKVSGGGLSIGLQALAEGTTGNRGIWSIVNSNNVSGTSNQYGIWSEAAGSGTGFHYGIKSRAAGSGYNVGIHAIAEFGTDNYAGIFDGDVTINGKLKLQGKPFDLGTPTAGQVLKWDGTKWSPGNALSESFSLTENTDVAGVTSALAINKAGSLGGPTALTIDSKSGGGNSALRVTADNTGISAANRASLQWAGSFSATGEGGTNENIAILASASSKNGYNTAIDAKTEIPNGANNASLNHQAINAYITGSITPTHGGTAVRGQSTVSGGGTSIGVFAFANGDGENKATISSTNSTVTNTANQYGIYSTVTGAGIANHYGVFTEATGKGSNYGIHSRVSDGAENTNKAQFGVLTHASGSGSATHYGLYTTSSGKGVNLGIYAEANAGTIITGGNFNAYPDNNTTTAYGLTSFVSGAPGSPNLYGLLASVSRSETSTTGASAYGIYSFADTGIPNTYSGYFSGNVQVTGNLTVGGTFSNPSDRRLKENIQPMSSVLDKLMQLRPSTYRFRKQNRLEGLTLRDGEQFGLIAQEVETIFPELVKSASYTKLKEEHSDSKDGKTVVNVVPSNEKEEIKTLDYNSLIPILIKGMQEQQEQIKNQQQQINILIEEIRQLKSK